MYKDLKFIDCVRQSGRHYKKRIIIYVCDECGILYESKFYKLSYTTSSVLTFCSKECRCKSRSSGKIAEKRKKTCIEKYGVPFASQIEGASEKMIQTRIDVYGSAAPLHTNENSIKKYRKTMNDRYGCDYPMQNKDILQKCHETFMSKYGAHPFQLEKNKSSERSSVAGQKGYKTLALKKDGNWIISKPEKALRDFLYEQFGENNVELQASVFYNENRRWLIDFYIKSIDVYVQLDGEYWHGLNRPLECLLPQHRKTYDKDRMQDDWFAQNNKKIIRVTDKQLAICQKNKDFSDIIKRLGGY